MAEPGQRIDLPVSLQEIDIRAQQGKIVTTIGIAGYTLAPASPLPLQHAAFLLMRITIGEAAFRVMRFGGTIMGITMTRRQCDRTGDENGYGQSKAGPGAI